MPYPSQSSNLRVAECPTPHKNSHCYVVSEPVSVRENSCGGKARPSQPCLSTSLSLVPFLGSFEVRAFPTTGRFSRTTHAQSPGDEKRWKMPCHRSMIAAVEETTFFFSFPEGFDLSRNF